ncbi:MAG: hypothetical protein M3Y87_12740 [Myxococcota bacterium]|nr:hypothetical protein [Myxococcota bacterium]
MLSDQSEESLVADLVRGTELVMRLLCDEISFDVFLAEYDSFYHANALDGHEPGLPPRRLARFAAVIAMHEEIDAAVITRIYVGAWPADELASIGRVTPDQALVSLREIARRHAVGRLLEELAPK